MGEERDAEGKLKGIRSKQMAFILDATLEKLTPPERTALDYAALLPPDSIPRPWLRALVAKENPDAVAARPGYPDPWSALRRRLEGLRLLTAGDHVEIARLHRMVAAHLRERLAAVGGSEGLRPGHKPAQGNALGSRPPTTDQALKGRDNGRDVPTRDGGSG